MLNRRLPTKSLKRTYPKPVREFTEYVAYNEVGGISKRIPRELMDAWLVCYDKKGTLALGVWELIKVHDEIHVRLAPQFEIDERDNLWHSWNYTFVPYVP